MTVNGWLQIALFSVVIALLAKPFGGYMTRVFTGERTFLSPVLRPVERLFYWLCGVDESSEQHWLTYAVAMLLFSVVGFLSLYALHARAGDAAVQSRRPVGGRAKVSPSTRRSASSPTPTGSPTCPKRR